MLRTRNPPLNGAQRCAFHTLRLLRLRPNRYDHLQAIGRAIQYLCAFSVYMPEERLSMRLLALLQSKGARILGAQLVTHAESRLGWCAPQGCFFRLALPSFRAQRFAFHLLRLRFASHHSVRQQPLGCRPEVLIGGKLGRVLLDQIRCVDKNRLSGKLGEVDAAQCHNILLEMLG